MKYDLDISKYKQYFHYGLYFEKNDILDAIIMDSSNEFNSYRRIFSSYKIDSEKVNVLKEEIDQSEELYLQFRRFIEMTADGEQGWYRKIGKKDVETDVEQRIGELEKGNLINVVTYRPMWGIYITDRWSFDENEYLGVHRFRDIPDWIQQDILPILKYLRQLEKENSYQYASLFMDTKYARSIHCEQGADVEKVKKWYAMFMETVKPAKSDVSQLFGKDLTKEQQQFVCENSADYWTITDLKQQAETEQYRVRLRQYRLIFEERQSREER